MKLIHKTDFEIIERQNISEKKRKHWAVISPDIELTTVIDGEIVEKYPQKYIKDISLNIDDYDFIPEGGTEPTLTYDICTSIEEMSAEEKAAVDADAAEKIRVASFQGKRIKMRIDYDYALENMNSFVLRCDTDTNIFVNVVKIETKDENGNITGLTREATILMDTVLKSDYDTIKPLIVATILQVDTIGGEPLDYSENEIYKYLVPQQVV